VIISEIHPKNLNSFPLKFIFSFFLRIILLNDKFLHIFAPNSVEYLLLSQNVDIIYANNMITKYFYYLITNYKTLNL